MSNHTEILCKTQVVSRIITCQFLDIAYITSNDIIKILGQSVNGI